MGVGASVTPDAVIYIPGIMGSELVNAENKVVWGARLGTAIRQVFLRDVFERIEPRPNDGIRASRPIQFPAVVPFVSGIEPYVRLEKRLREIVLDPAAVSAYAYDWRHSIADAAAGLVPVARNHLAQWRQRFAALPEEVRRGLPGPKLTLVGHSMGGLVASQYVTMHRDEGGSEVRRVITLGTPFQGSLNAVQVLATGKQLPFGLYAGSLRSAARQMPGLYELIARYKAVEDAGGRRQIAASDIADIGGSADMAEAAFATLHALDGALRTVSPDLFRCLVGTTQPTWQSVAFEGGVPALSEVVTDAAGNRADHGGDGTVFRYAASPPEVTGMPIPQTHGSLARTTEGTEFAAAMATERELGDFLAAAEIRVRAPEIAEIGRPFEVVATLASDSNVTCQIHNAETNTLAQIAQVKGEGEDRSATLTIKQPGLYRLSITATGFSPIERLLLVLED